MGRVLEPAETEEEAEREREFRFTDRDFQRIRQLVGEHTGIALTDVKRQLVYSRLARRLRKLGLDSFAIYCRRLEEDDEELVCLINAITTNHTAFFREAHHFDFLAKELLPRLMHSGQRRLRIWSAGCSSGQEPYTIAMVLKEHLPTARPWDVKILATDLDSDMIATAEQGVYPLQDIQPVPAPMLKRWFLRGTGAMAERVKVVPELKEWIRFRQLNLMHAWPMQGPFDLIFCRNVTIYFDTPTKVRLFDRFADMLAADGHMIIGHSETLLNISDRFELVGKTIYRKRP